MTTVRLDSNYPGLAGSFRQAPAAKRREAARIASELAVSSAGLADPEVAAALDALREGASTKARHRSELEALAVRFDDEYLQLSEEGGEADKSGALRLFSKARATAALAFAMSDDDAELHEAIYEAIAAVANPSELVRSVAIALQ